jgi:hypothetical protein
MTAARRGDEYCVSNVHLPETGLCFFGHVGGVEENTMHDVVQDKMWVDCGSSVLLKIGQV